MILEDIRRLGLVPGDTYRTSREVATMLGISQSTAMRAMNQLAEQGVLESRIGSGTTIGLGYRKPEIAQQPVIQLMMPRFKTQSGLSLDTLIYGIHDALPDASIMTTLYDRDDPMPDFERLIKNGRDMEQLLGVGVIRAPRMVQELLLRKRVPTVLLGTPNRGLEQLPSLDADTNQMGRLIGQYLLEKGHRRFALLRSDRVPPGELNFFRGFSQVLSEAGILCGALEVVHCPVEMEAISYDVQTLFELPERPTALVGHPYRAFEEGVMDAAAKYGLREGADFDFVTDTGATYPKPPRCPVQMIYEPDRVGQLFGEMLGRLSRGEELPERHIEIPVELKQERRD